MPFAAPAPPTDYLDMSQLVERWHASRATLDRWRKTGIPGTTIKLSAVKLGRRVLFRTSAVVEIEQAVALMGTAAVVRRRRRRKAVPA